MKNILLMTILLIGISSWAAGKISDLTDPTVTSNIYDSMLKGMINSMVVADFEKPENKIPATPVAAAVTVSPNLAPVKHFARKNHSAKPRQVPVKEVQEPIIESAEAVLPKTFEFKGSQMWGDATAKIRTESNSFEAHVSCSLLVTMWTLKTPDGTILGQGRLRETQAFDFSINEMFAPPYILVLNVVYMDMPNQILIKMEKQ